MARVVIAGDSTDGGRSSSEKKCSDSEEFHGGLKVEDRFLVITVSRKIVMAEDEYRSVNGTQYARMHLFVPCGSRLASYTALCGKNTRLEGRGLN
jgi:hypothetical protein